MGASVKPKAKRGRPLKPLITKDAAVEAAIVLVEREGIDSLSVQGVARAMGVTAPSLYYHFKDKDELLALVAYELLKQMGEGAHQDAPWEERMIELSVNTRRVFLRHANAAPLLLRFFPRKLMLGAYESSLKDNPYPQHAQAVVIDAIEKLTYGASFFAAAATAHNEPAMPEFSSSRFPLLSAALEAGPADDEALFVESLRALFDGFRARYGQK